LKVQGIHFLTTELVDGQSLAGTIPERRPLRFLIARVDSAEVPFSNRV